MLLYDDLNMRAAFYAFYAFCALIQTILIIAAGLELM
jgi:hypothetical protein